MPVKTDLRIIRTRKMIKEAFLDLIEMKGYESITIQNIADRALVNRATFYLHYRDKQDLLDLLIQETLHELSEAINPCEYLRDQRVKVSNFHLLIKTIFDKIIENEKFYRVMMIGSGVNGFGRKMEEVIKGKFNEELFTYGIDEEALGIAPELLTTFISSALMGMIGWWLQEDLHYSSSKLADQAVKLYVSGPLGSVGFRVSE